MRLSDEKITHMTHVILKGLLDRGVIDITEDEGTVRRAMKRAITAELKVKSATVLLSDASISLSSIGRTSRDSVNA